MNENKNENKLAVVSSPQKPVHELMHRQVSRSEFLSIVGFGALGIIGLGPIVHFLTGKSSKTVIHHKYQTSGFGSGPYGV